MSVFNNIRCIFSHPGLWIFSLCIVVLIPWALVPIPPLIDYVNHLTRLWLISGGINIAPLNQFYAIEWHGLATNMAIDLAAAAVGHLIGPFTLGRILLALAMLLPPLGAICLHRRIYGQWCSWQILFLFFWCTQTLLAGFLNFQLSLGLALFAAVADTFLTGTAWPLRTGIRILCGLVLIITHPFGLMFYGALLAALKYGPAPASQGQPVSRSIRALITACIIFIPFLISGIFTHAVPGFNMHRHFSYIAHSPLEALQAIQSPFYAYDMRMDVPLELLFILGSACILLSSGKKITHGGFLTMAGILWLLSLLMPKALGQATWVDHRLPIMAVYVSLISVVPQYTPQSRSLFKRALIIAVTLVTLRTGWIGWNWLGSNAMVAETHDALSVLPKGSRLLPLQYIQNVATFRHPGRAMHYWETFRHFSDLAVIWRHAYIPTLFALPGQQPLRVRPPYLKYSSDWSGSYLCSQEGLSDISKRPQGDDFMRYWKTHFDYALLLNADQIPEGKKLHLPDQMHLVRDSGFARLYKITRQHKNTGS